MGFRSVFRDLSEAGLKSVHSELNNDVDWLIRLVFFLHDEVILLLIEQA